MKNSFYNFRVREEGVRFSTVRIAKTRSLNARKYGRSKNQKE